MGWPSGPAVAALRAEGLVCAADGHREREGWAPGGPAHREGKVRVRAWGKVSSWEPVPKACVPLGEGLGHAEGTGRQGEIFKRFTKAAAVGEARRARGPFPGRGHQQAGGPGWGADRGGCAPVGDLRAAEGGLRDTRLPSFYSVP